MKKLLIIGAEVQPIPPVEGGAVEYLVDLILKSDLFLSNYEITVVSPRTIEAEAASQKYCGVSFLYIDARGFIDRLLDFCDLFFRRFFDMTLGISYIHKVCRYLKNNSFDVVLVENRPYFGKCLKKVFDGPLVLHLHNDFINSKTRHLSDIVPFFSGMIVVSGYLKNKVREVFGGRVDVVYNGIEIDSSDVNCTNGEKTFLYAGRIVKEKGVIELIHAFSRLSDADVRLQIIGNFDPYAYQQGDFIDEFEKLTAADRRIEIVGYVQHQDIHNYYKRAYVGVVPSIVEEAFGLSALEMMANGVPVIASDAGGLKEVVNKNCGIVVNRDGLEDELYSAMKELANNKQHRDYLAQNAQLTASQFSQDVYLRELHRAIEAYDIMN